VLISATLNGQGNLAETMRMTAADGFLHEPVEPDRLASMLWKVVSAA
jgi:hypothetical protein